MPFMETITGRKSNDRRKSVKQKLYFQLLFQVV